MITEQQLEALNVLASHVYQVASNHGFHDNDEANPGRFGEYCANLHGEVSELWEAWRKGQLNLPCDKSEKMLAAGIPALTCAEEELADIVIRACDTAKGLGVDLAHAIYWKDRYNQSRPHMHGKKA